MTWAANTVLEGAHRPGHFNGVCIIVHKLLEAVQPDTLYLGEKDYQQCMVVKHLIETIGMAINLVICPYLRDVDGFTKRGLEICGSLRKLGNMLLLFTNALYISKKIEKIIRSKNCKLNV